MKIKDKCIKEIIDELNRLELECIQTWKNKDMIDAVKEFTSVLKYRIKTKKGKL